MVVSLPFMIGILVVMSLLIAALFYVGIKQRQVEQQLAAQFEQTRQLFSHEVHQLQLQLSDNNQVHALRLQEQINTSQLNGQEMLGQTVQRHMVDIREQIQHSFKQHAESLSSLLQSLTTQIRDNLESLSQQVNVRLTEGFEKTSSTFINIATRLTIIDEAQKKISELSTQVVSLQDVLQDKRSRGAFGEVQLSSLIANMIPPHHYSMQHTLSNQKRADCILFLPAPSGNIVIDAKFPLETYQKLVNCSPVISEKRVLQQQFKLDIQKHIKDIAEKYIIVNETADGAVMFIPAEAIFAEIHSNYPEIITLAQRLKVWLVSPTTLMAVLTTARAVLKDDATRKQVHIIQKHLQALSEDFQRFEKRMDKLSKHIDLAHQDVSEVNTSAKKISQRFQKIESVDLLIQES